MCMRSAKICHRHTLTRKIKKKTLEKYRSKNQEISVKIIHVNSNFNNLPIFFPT